MRIQVEFDEPGVETLDRLKRQTGLSTYKDLFNNALALFSWALGERLKGQIIVSLNEDSREYKELQMPSLERAAETRSADSKDAA